MSIFFRINKDSDVTNIESGQIYDLSNITFSDRLNNDTDGSIASIFCKAFSDDSDDGLNKTQTYFVEVIDQNRFKLYRNKISTNIIDNIISVTQSASTGQIGDLTTQASAGVSVTGVEGTGQISQLLVWGEIIPGQDAEWAVIDDSQTASWSEIDDSQSPDWTDVAA